MSWRPGFEATTHVQTRIKVRKLDWLQKHGDVLRGHIRDGVKRMRDAHQSIRAGNARIRYEEVHIDQSIPLPKND